ncbi:MAG TPA: protein-methionine-sulfoxide reductase heme-binding subunit MsrQ [Vicinamibacterales bacterium]|nr:protein-methionine-sulfoxide reductase heme-binding subunit MsrQ [Vicinamibacterales bacterium]
MTQTQLVRRVLKPVVFLACLVPAGWLLSRALWGDLGVNPLETLTNETGIWTLRLLVATIAITPIRWVSGWNPIITLRRMIGLFAFFYGTVHFFIYFLFDRSLMFDGLWEDIVLRPYITVGFTAFVLMIPLAITSTRGWIRRLGGPRWNLLHKLVYVSAALGVLHYWWKVKLDVTNPMIYAVIVGVLLGWRVVKTVTKRQAARAGRTIPART